MKDVDFRDLDTCHLSFRVVFVDNTLRLKDQLGDNAIKVTPRKNIEKPENNKTILMTLNANLLVNI